MKVPQPELSSSPQEIKISFQSTNLPIYVIKCCPIGFQILIAQRNQKKEKMPKFSLQISKSEASISPPDGVSIGMAFLELFTKLSLVIMSFQFNLLIHLVYSGTTAVHNERFDKADKFRGSDSKL